LIVFFAAIREILKRGIYGRDKHCFWAMKTKGERASIAGLISATANAGDSLYE